MKVRYGFVDSPLGKLFVAVSPDGVLRVGFLEEDPRDLLEEIEDLVRADVVEGGISAVRREFDSYFRGRSRRFTVKPDLSLVAPGFSRRVLEATTRIPYGEVSTYGDVAAWAGSPRGGRAAGNALRGNPVPLVVPCHRVIPASGGVGGYSGHEERKAFLLAMEGPKALASEP